MTDSVRACLEWVSREVHGARLYVADSIRSAGAISSGSVAIDSALGVGGWPRGRISELFGGEGVGKSTLAGMAVAQAHAQSPHAIALWIDGDYALDSTRLQELGADLSRTITAQVDTAEQAFGVAYAALQAGVDIVVADALCSFPPAQDFSCRTPNDAQAHLNATALRLLLAPLARARAVMLVVSQIRDRQDVVFGCPVTTTGGRALRHYASVRAELKRMYALKRGEWVIGQKIRFTVVKSKIAQPYATTELDLGFSDRPSPYDGQSLIQSASAPHSSAFGENLSFSTD